MKWLDANYDAQDYSLWKVTYKYPTELTQGMLAVSHSRT
jgi:elongation factor 1-gamma